MKSVNIFQWTLLAMCWINCIDGITELKPIQKISHKTLDNRGMIQSILTRKDAFFHHIPGYTSSGEILLGARNRLYSAPVPDVNAAREVLEWKPKNCKNRSNNKAKCPHMDKVSDTFICGNHIRLVLAYSDRESSKHYKRNTEKVPDSLLIVCGSNGGNPECQIYRKESPHWIPAKTNITGNGVVNGRLCPGERNPFYFNESMKKLFVSTRTQNKPTFVSFYASDSVTVDLHIKGHPTFFGSADSVTFHSIFRYEDKVYVLFNEEAYENDYNSNSIFGQKKQKYVIRKKHFARVARVCMGDQGSTARDRSRNYFSTFFKARLLCQSPSGFKFDYLVAVSMVDTSDSDPLIRGVFAADDGLTRAHGICYFRTSDIERGIKTGEFVKFKGEKDAKYLQRQKVSIKLSKFMRCHNRKASYSIAGFAKQNPLKTDPVVNDDSYPWKAFTANSYNITAITYDVSSGHEVLFLGTDNGLLLKLSSYPIETTSPGSRLEFSVIESLQLFGKHIRINSLILKKDHVVAISNDEVRAIKLHRCGYHLSCRDCIGSQDPYCSWNAVRQQCSSTAEKYPSVKAGMAYCNSVETKPTNHVRNPTALNRTGSLKEVQSGISTSTVVIIGAVCLITGCIIGCLLECVIFNRFGNKLPNHLLQEVRRKCEKNLGKENPNTNATSINTRNYFATKAKRSNTDNTFCANEYDSFIDHHSAPNSSPTDKKLNNEIIKNNLMASLHHHKSIDNFL